MARTLAALPEGSWITDYISFGVIAKTFPLKRVHSVLAATGKASLRERDLPAHAVVYYAITLALCMQSSYREVLRCLLEGVQWLLDRAVALKVAGNSGVSQARTRLGWEPLQQLHDQAVRPIALAATQGAWYRGLRLVSVDGSTMETADEMANATAFGRPGASRGESAFPQLRFGSLVENGTHVQFGTQMAPYATSEIALAKCVLNALGEGMLCLADRNFFGFALWTQVHSTGAEPVYRLLTSLLDPGRAPAAELAALNHQRREIETALAERKTHLRGAKIVSRSKTPDLVRQEFYGLLMAHFAIRGLMHEAALKADIDPDRFSFLHAVRVARRKPPSFHTIPRSTVENLS